VPKLKQDAYRGGRIAGNARKDLEKELGRTVVSKENYLPRRQAGLLKVGKNKSLKKP